MKFRCFIKPQERSGTNSPIRCLGNSTRSSLPGSPLFRGNISREDSGTPNSPLMAPSIHHWRITDPALEMISRRGPPHIKVILMGPKNKPCYPKGQTFIKKTMERSSILEKNANFLWPFSIANG